jgi:hypothetical protein
MSLQCSIERINYTCVLDAHYREIHNRELQMATSENKIDLNKIPVDWITIDPRGEIIIKDKKFAEHVKESIGEVRRGGRAAYNNGGCQCN